MRNAVLWIIISYFIGSCPTGYLVARLVKGIDIRTCYSGNIGAANVRRVMGHGWAVFVTAIDMLKGALALLVTGAGAAPSPWLLSLAGIAAVAGHNYPVWLKFKGGKGVATTYGVMFFLCPYESFAITLLSGAIWYAVMKSTRYASLSSMLSLLSMPLFFWMLELPVPFIVTGLALAAFAAYRHSANIDRLMRGVENRI